MLSLCNSCLCKYMASRSSAVLKKAFSSLQGSPESVMFAGWVPGKCTVRRVHPVCWKRVVDGQKVETLPARFATCLAIEVRGGFLQARGPKHPVPCMHASLAHARAIACPTERVPQNGLADREVEPPHLPLQGNISVEQISMDSETPARTLPYPRMISLSDPFAIERSTPAAGNTQDCGSCEGWSVLPTDVIGLVARELGPHEAQAMTRVCRSWLQAIDRTLTQLKPRSLHAAQLVNRCNPPQVWPLLTGLPGPSSLHSK